MTKVVILAGGKGTRLAEETVTRPKPMVEIGGKPILWHIMKIYAAHGLTEFIVCLGYKGEIIKDYFLNYRARQASFTLDLGTGAVNVHSGRVEPWRVTLVDTGDEVQTGGRRRRVRDLLDPGAPFCLTYGDGVANVDVKSLMAFHSRQRVLATVTAVIPPARFGALVRADNRVLAFREKPLGAEPSINGGFFVLDPSVIDRITDDNMSFEREPLESLAQERQLASWEHAGFWQPMDTLRDKQTLEELWATGKAPWKVW
jgi:glucose-1-phosphate cytidylyltransferase